MHSIKVEPKSDVDEGHVYEVTLGEAGDSSQHIVSVPTSYWQKLTGGKIDKTELVRRSFEFLLSREPKESILNRFELPVIQRYFKDYEESITIK
ncbi:MAG TPA: hypothetical protein VF996_02135 [Candidatus Saccharimonadales bacterium]